MEVKGDKEEGGREVGWEGERWRGGEEERGWEGGRGVSCESGIPLYIILYGGG